MNKKDTDRAMNRWALKCLFGPASVMSLFAFFIGYWWPDTMAVMQPIAQSLGLHKLVAMRVIGTKFDAAAYLYWLMFWVTLPLNLYWIHREKGKTKLNETLRAIGLANLNSGLWNPQKFTLLGGYLRHFGFVMIWVSLFVIQLVTAHEPSSCKGCETTSLWGFILINWMGVHVLLLASYFSCLYFVLWKSIRLAYGKNNE